MMLVLFCASVAANGAAALEDGRVGQYFCYVDHAVGIQMRDNGRTFAGKITLPDDDMKFFVRISRVELDASTKDICAKTAESFQKAFVDGTEIRRLSGKLFGGETFADACLKPFKAEIPKGEASRDAWTFRGWGAYEFEGGITNMSFTLYGTNEFTWLFHTMMGLLSGRADASGFKTQIEVTGGRSLDREHAASFRNKSLHARCEPALDALGNLARVP
ncbi:hypothetical protein A5906_30840 [Bradyrhizobium sacchari]|nr:hypothetical protein A5906_30840 [Bradyrhizobium sacchari]